MFLKVCLAKLALYPTRLFINRIIGKGDDANNRCKSGMDIPFLILWLEQKGLQILTTDKKWTSYTEIKKY
jgi:hypothetical protein